MTLRPPTDLVLHVGAPKCGSSALQGALSAQPDGVSDDGTAYRYIGCRNLGRAGLVTFTGARLRKVARAARHGYAAWPNLTADAEAGGIWQSMQRTVLAGRRGGYVPIVSNEGWFANAPRFRENLFGQRGPTATVVVFVRPPLDWLNAAYWQWGVWSGLGIDAWVAHPATAYRLGTHVAEWAATPGVRVRLRASTDDVVAGFGQVTGLALTSGAVANASASTALLGFLLRNRRFRPSAHESWVEFAVQRWCPPDHSPRPWAIRRSHLLQLWPRALEDVALLRRAVADDGAEVLSHPGWSGTSAYDARLDAAPTRLDDADGLDALHASLLAGVAAAAAACGVSSPAVRRGGGRLGRTADLDVAVAAALDRLLALDATWRRHTSLVERVGRRLIGRTANPSPLPLRRTDAHEARPAEDTLQGLHDHLATETPAQTRTRRLFNDCVTYVGPDAVLEHPLVLVASTDGCGADHIAGALCDSGAAGGGGRPFLPDTIEAALVEHPAATFPAHLTRLGATAGAGGRMLCAEVRWTEIAMLRRWSLLAMFPAIRVVVVRRDDRMVQAALCAVSRSKGGEPVFDAHAIARELAALRREADLTDIVLQALDLPTIHLSLEQYAARPLLHLNRILSFCGAPQAKRSPLALPPPGPSDLRAAAYAASFRSTLREAIL